MSDYPVIGFNEVTNFGHVCNILDDEYVKLAEFDLIFIASNVVHHGFTKSEERNLQRYEFLEFLTRIAIHRYVDPHRIVKDKSTAIESLLAELIYPNAKTMNGDYFRKRECYNVKVNEVI